MDALLVGLEHAGGHGDGAAARSLDLGDALFESEDLEEVEVDLADVGVGECGRDLLGGAREKGEFGRAVDGSGGGNEAGEQVAQGELSDGMATDLDALFEQPLCCAAAEVVEGADGHEEVAVERDLEGSEREGGVAEPLERGAEGGGIEGPVGGGNADELALGAGAVACLVAERELERFADGACDRGGDGFAAHDAVLEAGANLGVEGLVAVAPDPVADADAVEAGAVGEGEPDLAVAHLFGQRLALTEDLEDLAAELLFLGASGVEDDAVATLHRPLERHLHGAALERHDGAEPHAAVARRAACDDHLVLRAFEEARGEPA